MLLADTIILAYRRSLCWHADGDNHLWHVDGYFFLHVDGNNLFCMSTATILSGMSTVTYFCMSTETISFGMSTGTCFACRRRQSFLHVDQDNLVWHVDRDNLFCMSTETTLLACRRSFWHVDASYPKKIACDFNQAMNKSDFKRPLGLTSGTSLLHRCFQLHLSAKHLPQRRLQLLCWDWSLTLNQDHACLLQSTWISFWTWDIFSCIMPYHAHATASKRRLKSLALLAAVTARMALMVFRMQLQNTLEVQHAASSKCLKTTQICSKRKCVQWQPSLLSESLVYRLLWATDPSRKWTARQGLILNKLRDVESTQKPTKWSHNWVVLKQRSPNQSRIFAFTISTSKAFESKISSHSHEIISDL